MVDLTLDRLLDLERRGWDALCGSTGGAFYGALMTPSALMVLVDGSVLDRDAVVASLDGAPPWDSYELHDVRRVGLGDGAQFFDEHVEADAVHEQLAMRAICEQMALEDPSLEEDIIVGAVTSLSLDGPVATELFAAWERGRHLSALPAFQAVAS